jgi:poly(A) RNA polymerase GLD2
MNRLDAGRNRQGPSNRPNNKRKRGQNGPENGPNRGVTGVRVIKAGPPPVDYTERYKPEYGCPLTSYVKEYFNDNQQTQADYKQKNEIRNWIEECLERFSLDYTCYIVGSTSNGFGTKSSDVDICLVVDHEREQVSKSETMKALKKTRSALRSCGHPGHDLELIPAKVPILRLHKKNIQIDINCNNLTGLRNTWLLNAYSAVSPKLKEPRIRPLAMFVKKIAKKCKINNPMEGTLSRYESSSYHIVPTTHSV